MTWMHRGVRAEHLAVVRIVVFAVWFAIIAATSTGSFHLLPEELLDPRGFARLLPLEAVFWTPWLAGVAKALTLLGCLACLLGVRPHGVVATATVSLIFLHDAVLKSLGGYSNHAQSGLLMVAALVAAFPAADALSVSGRRSADRSPWLYRTPLVASALLIALTYSFIGTRRLFVGGGEVFTDGSIERWAVGRTLEYSWYDLDVGLMVLDQRWLVPVLVGGMAVATVFEIVSPLVIRYRKLLPYWLAVIVPFHLATAVSMNILFWENLILILFLFTGLTDAVVRRLDRAGRDPTAAPEPVSP